MKSFFFLSLSISLFFGCKKESIDEITYEVTLTGSDTWHGSYLNENAQAVGVENVPSGWKYSFKNSRKIATVIVNAYPDGINETSESFMKIYVNGILVASAKSSISPQAQYIFSN